MELFYGQRVGLMLVFYHGRLFGGCFNTGLVVLVWVARAEGNFPLQRGSEVKVDDSRGSVATGEESVINYIKYISDV